MPIPAEILAIERPKGTIVQKSGNKYYVIKRTSKYDKGRRVPVNLGIVGEIRDGKYVERIRRLDGIQVDVKDYANVMLAHKCGKELLSDLMLFFSPEDSEKIYTYAMIKVLYGDIPSRDMRMHYDTSFLSELFPKVPCSRKTVGEYLDKLGRHVNMLNTFMKARLDAIDPKAFVIIDGMLKNNNSITNTFSEFSRKGKIKNSEDISILYALDYHKKEPLACAVYPGNMLDKTSFRDFSKKFDIKKGVIIGDKGIELNDDQRKEIAELSDLKYLVPIKRNLSFIKKKGLQEYDDIVDIADESILCKKTEVDGIFYYAFLDIYLQGSEAKGYMVRAKSKLKKNAQVQTLLKKYRDKKDAFGTIVFESNVDASCSEIYMMYTYRWAIEEVFNYYKNVLDIDNVKVQQDTRLYGGEFINYIASVITCRIRNYIDACGLSENYSFRQIMSYLSKAKKCRSISAPADWFDTVTLKYISDILNVLNINV